MALCKHLQNQIDEYNTELSDDFMAGIKARFSKKQARKYNAWWNHVRQDVVTLTLAPEHSAKQASSHPLESIEDRIVSRSSRSLLGLLQKKQAIYASASVHSFQRNLLETLVKRVADNVHESPKFRYLRPTLRPRTDVDEKGLIHYSEVLIEGPQGSSDYVELLRKGSDPSQNHGPCINLKSRHRAQWQANGVMTDQLLSIMSLAANIGITFAGKSILITGAGPGSIGADCARHFLMGGAKVLVTTSREPAETSTFYRLLYEECGAKGSELLILPANLCSTSDCNALIDHIYDDSGLALDLDAVLPFAAISEVGFEIDMLEGKSELAHRLMLVNVLRLLGRIIFNKRKKQISCHPTQVLLPLSPNHGIFGGDGLYSESKLGLESLLNRVTSESWSDELSICGVVIGWTRGTGLMSSNDVLAEDIEKHGVLTFSQNEMAFNIVTLISPEIARICEEEAVVADFSGGLDCLENCKIIISQSKARIDAAAKIAKAVNDEDLREAQILGQQSDGSSPTSRSADIRQRSRLQIGFPPLPDYEKDISRLSPLKDMVDLSSTIVVVGFSELGPWGTSRTRWEIESKGTLSQEGFIEMAWIMNLIKHFDGDTPSGPYVGWIDVRTGARVHDCEVEAVFGQQILEHAGIRFVDPALFGGYNPKKKEFLQEVVVEEDLPEFHTTVANAEALRLKDLEHVLVQKSDLADDCVVQLKRGAVIQVPKIKPFDGGLVAGQIPSGWSPTNYGLPSEIVNQVDRVTLYTLCCVAEALYSAGITDAMEIFQHIHLSEFGHFVGSSMGGASKTREMYRDIFLDRDIQSDVIQETYLNTPAAWVNMLLFGSTGPIKTPVGACATGVESIDSGFDSILAGKTKMCLVGGVDDFHEDESFGFSKMKATVDTAEQMAQGWLPNEMSRPTSDTRAGFVEAHGCGVQIICSASLAIEMGLPIYGIIAGTTMAADKISRSVPAPGQGVLTFARESAKARHSPLLDLDYRREQMYRQMRALSRDPTDTPSSSASFDSDSTAFVMVEPLQELQYNTAHPQIQAIKRSWSTNLRSQDPTISPLRAALATWGLTIEDIAFASLHATSTKANDKNEADVINKQMEHLGRDLANPLLAVCQKSVTGHPKAPAAAWMLNGCLQTMIDGLVPGNRNADNVDSVLQKFEHLIFPTRPLQTREIKAFLLNSFGFGQKGGQIVGVAARYLFATLGQDEFAEYANKCRARMQLANRAYVKALLNNKVVNIYNGAPYNDGDESRVFLDPLARITETPERGRRYDSSSFESRPQHKDKEQASTNTPRQTDIASERGLAVAVRIARAELEQRSHERRHDTSCVGIDVVNLTSFKSDENEVFLRRNFTVGERTYAKEHMDSHATYASRWCAKEAVFKSLGTFSRGAGAAMQDIEIVSEYGRGPTVKVSQFNVG